MYTQLYSIILVKRTANYIKFQKFEASAKKQIDNTIQIWRPNNNNYCKQKGCFDVIAARSDNIFFYSTNCWVIICILNRQKKIVRGRVRCNVDFLLPYQIMIQYWLNSQTLMQKKRKVILSIFHNIFGM